jgi:hypothetical protein
VVVVVLADVVLVVVVVVVVVVLSPKAPGIAVTLNAIVTTASPTRRFIEAT